MAEEGDLLLTKEVKLYPDRTGGNFKRRHHVLIRKYEGQFMVVKRVGKLAYKLDLPPEFKVHPVFHVCNLKPFHADDDDPTRSAQQRELVLQLPDYSKSFEVQTDASDYAIDGILMQDGHPIAFKSRKLKDAERR